MTALARTVGGATLALFALTACGDRSETENRMVSDTTVATSTSSGTLSTMDEIDIDEIELGRAVGSDGKISETTDEFRPTDGIIAVVETDDKQAGKELLARWTYGESDEVVFEQRQTVAAGTEARTQFRLTKQTPWPTGSYHLRILYNGKEVKSAEFSVR